MTPSPAQRIRLPKGSSSSATPPDTRFDELELNIAITALPIDGSGMPDLSIPHRVLPTLSDDQLLKTPGVLSGSTTDMADTVREYRDKYGVTYLIIQQPHADAFAKVIAELR